jgi:2-keto-4-pentenoate hydratase/2-oxohepta-3-ene-1,7-dioic acid hydratase in catechol pathway
MRLANLLLRDGRRVLAVRSELGPLIDVSDVSSDRANSIRDAVQRGPGYMKELGNLSRTRPAINNDQIKAFLPLTEPDSKIFCVGLNYTSHAVELGQEVPKQPSIFCRYASTCVGHEQSILVPKSSSAVDWEGELAVVIGRSIKNVGERDALAAIGGVTCFNDVSIRDFQERLPRITLAKNFDASGPIGPWLTTMDEVGDINKLRLITRVNGKVMQDASTAEFIFSLEYLIDLISQACELRPGDVIATGTPGGVAWKRNPPCYLKEGDAVEVDIERVGVLKNFVQQEA